MRIFKALKPGDTIGIAAPSSPFDRAKFVKGVRVLERMGFKTFHRHDIFDQNRYLAGTDRRRAEEFIELVADRNISAIMFARGGYGSQRIIPLLDPKILSERPKPVIGFSDVTSLLAFLRQRFCFPTFYGPVITQLGGAKEPTMAEGLFKALSTSGPLGAISMGNSKTLKAGNAEGPIVGGCLSLINSSIGTPYETDTQGSVLFIEDINEKVYVLDRMLTQLKNSGKIDGALGIIFGSILPPEGEPHDVEAMIKDVLGDFKGPVISGFPAGHVDDFVTLALGAKVSVSVPVAGAPSLTYSTGLFQ